MSSTQQGNRMPSPINRPTIADRTTTTTRTLFGDLGKAIAIACLSVGAFIAGLGLKIQIEPLADEQLPRVAQLIQRTNQFNCTTIRRAEGDIRQLLNRSEVLTVSVSDRFGDYGLTGVVIIEQKGSSLDVESFLLSCRVLGRGVEHRVVARLGELAQERKLEWVEIHFNPSPKNKPAFDFLQSIGEKFQQSLNGGYVFRFPATDASQVRFDPQSDEIEPAGLIQRQSSIVQSIQVTEGPAEARTTHTCPAPYVRHAALRRVLR